MGPWDSALSQSKLIWSRPLESGGVLPSAAYQDGPPVVGPHEPEPLDDEEHEHEDVGANLPHARHISLWISSPLYGPEGVDVAFAFPLSIDEIYDAARDARNNLAQSWLTYVVATRPQVHDDYGSLLLLPEWIARSDKFGLLLDATAVHKEIFALYHSGPITRYAMLRQVGIGNDEPFEVYVGGDLAPLAPQDAREPEQGLLVKILQRGAVVEWSGDLRDRRTARDDGGRRQSTLEGQRPSI